MMCPPALASIIPDTKPGDVLAGGKLVRVELEVKEVVVPLDWEDVLVRKIVWVVVRVEVMVTVVVEVLTLAVPVEQAGKSEMVATRMNKMILLDILGTFYFFII